MKLFLALLLASASAFAQVEAPQIKTQYGIGAGYDYDQATSNNVGLTAVTKTSIVGGVRGKYGQLDGGIYEVGIKGRFPDSIKGVEIGYGPAFPVGKAIITTRAAVGKLYERSFPARSETAYYRTFTVGAIYPINDKLAPFITYRYRPEQDLTKQHLYSVGVNYMATKNIQVQAAYRHTRAPVGPVLNGVSTQVLFMF